MGHRSDVSEGSSSVLDVLGFRQPWTFRREVYRWLGGTDPESSVGRTRAAACMAPLEVCSAHPICGATGDRPDWKNRFGKDDHGGQLGKRITDRSYSFIKRLRSHQRGEKGESQHYPKTQHIRLTLYAGISLN